MEYIYIYIFYFPFFLIKNLEKEEVEGGMDGEIWNLLT